MPSALKFIGGGLLSGLGKGLVLSGEAKREAALKRFERESAQKDALELEEVRQEGRQGLMGIRIDAQKTAANVVTGRDEDAAKLTASAKVKASETAAGVASTAADVLNTRKVAASDVASGVAKTAATTLNTRKERAARLKAASERGDISAADKRAIDIAVKRHSKLGGIIDNEKVVQQLIGMNRRDLAELYAGGPIGPTGLTQEQAEKQVDQEAEDRDTFLVGEGFPNDDEAAWRRLRLSQLAPQSTATASAPVSVASSPATTPAATPPQVAIDHLRANPALAPQFDLKYGAGAAAKALGR